MNLLGSIRSFIKVVEAGSIAGGARTLGLSAAAVSQNIARLEAHLKVRLLARTTRSMALTANGRTYYEKVRHVERDLELAQLAITADTLNAGVHFPLETGAADLGWKLAAALQGWGGPALLDSYDAERKRVM